VDLLKELVSVQDELRDVLNEVSDLQVRNNDLADRRDEVQAEFDENIVKNSAYKTIGNGKISNKEDIFMLLRENGILKKKIIEMIK
jgi:hypothetical protein